MTNKSIMMIKRKILITAAVLLTVQVTFFISGCEETTQQEAAPIFFPAAPDEPKIQFLKFYSGPDDVGEKHVISGFEAFIVGDDDGAAYTAIKKPYGVALYEGKLYSCDIDSGNVSILDLKTGSFDYITNDRRIITPVNIAIDDDGVKYVADAGAGAIFVFGSNNKIKAIWGREDGIKPVDIALKGDNLYVLDGNSSQVLVLHKEDGEELNRIGIKGEELGQLQYVTCLAVDDDENVYISDKIRGHITKLDSDGIFQQKIGRLGDAMQDFLRVKGLDIDREGRIWVVDSGSGMIKAYTPEGNLLIAFGYSTGAPGSTYLPTIIRIDYDHLDFFQQFAVEGAKLELLIIVTNQYGPYKINVYGLGSFPSPTDTE